MRLFPGFRNVRRGGLALLLLLFCTVAHAQSFFETAQTDGFGSPSILVGAGITRLDSDIGSDFSQFFVRGSVGIGRKTDVFGSIEGIQASEILHPNFVAWSAGLKHQFIRTHIVDVGSVIRLHWNHTDAVTFENALMDFAGIISFQASAFHPYYAIMFSRPFGFDLKKDFQKTSILGVEVPIGDIPRIFGEVTLGDRRSFGAALKLAF